MNAEKKSYSYLVRALLAGGVMFWVLRLSAGDRGGFDFVVIGLVALAIGWNLVMLGRRLSRGGEGRPLWHLQRTVLFWILGVLNTAMIRPDQTGTWRHWLGWTFLAIAVWDTYRLHLRERRALSQAGLEPSGSLRGS